MLDRLNLWASRRKSRERFVNMDVERIYDERFPEEDRATKDDVWRVLCTHFFQRYVASDATVLDLGAGFCEFLRHIECGRRIAVDVNPKLSAFVPRGTEIVTALSHDLRQWISDSSVDVVFASNFFEHLPDKTTFMATLGEVKRILRQGGKLLALQPNIRILGGAYWDFLDHHVPLSDRSLAEAVTMTGLKVIELVPRFLPYTTKSRIPQHPWLVRLYLSFPPLWRVMGGQAWLVAVKP